AALKDVAVGKQLSASSALQRTFSITANSSVAVGSEVIDRAIDDTVGGIYVADELPIVGTVTTWQVTTGASSAGHQLTPLLLKQTDETHFQIVGIGKTQTVAAGSTQQFNFEVQAGAIATGPGIFLGWADAST